jgi:parallel beta-helix repeat protein
MKGKIAVLCLLLLLSALSYTRFSQTETKASSSLPVHNLSTGLNYTTIQDAINANETLDGQTILVDSGEYNETIMINKSISLVGENRNNTVINPTYNTPPSINPFNAIVNVTANNTEIAGFDLAGGWYFIGISARTCSNITIRNNIIKSSGSAISLTNNAKSTIVENVLIGLGLEGNELLVLDSCNQCTIEDNTVENACYDGILMVNSNNNLVYDNRISNNQYGVDFSGGDSGNAFFDNSFEGNNHQITGTYSGNFFNSSSEGNYWSDYIGKDANQDGIGDTPYSNLDYFPLMGTFENFTASNYSVQTVSSSTISNFHFNGTAINFDVSGENGTTGFCRICIPTALIGTGYKILVNGTEVQYKLLPNSNSTHNYLYFTYHQSTQEVMITPEFPSFLILPLFFITTLFSAIIYKKRRQNRSFHASI